MTSPESHLEVPHEGFTPVRFTAIPELDREYLGRWLNNLTALKRDQTAPTYGASIIRHCSPEDIAQCVKWQKNHCGKPRTNDTKAGLRQIHTDFGSGKGVGFTAHHTTEGEIDLIVLMGAGKMLPRDMENKSVDYEDATISLFEGWLDPELLLREPDFYLRGRLGPGDLALFDDRLPHAVMCVDKGDAPSHRSSTMYYTM